ncbi:MAG: endonuclease III [Bacteroidota bacterium]
MKTLNRSKQRMSKILEILSGEYPDVTIQLNHNNAFELLIATILSAQCTDARVNEVTKKLFKKYNSPGDYVKAASEELEEDIYSTGFYKAKARNIKGACKMIINEFGGEVPGSMKDLLKLPGVGRKTANVLLGHMFDTPGIVVDTHVIKISTRLGFADTRNPEIIEKILENLIPVDKWVIFTHYFINHGRKVCRARKPDCGNCVINELCPSAFKI